MRRLAWMVVILAACGGDDDGGPLTAQSLPGAIASQYCNALLRCGLISDSSFCATADLGNDIDQNVIAAVENGTVIFNEDKARLCVGSIATTCSRGRLFNESDNCDFIFEGTVPEGGVCAIDEQCISQQCQVLSCPDACCQGTCVGNEPPVLPAVGESCADTFDCFDSFCDSATMLCTAYLPNGATCGGDSQCAEGYCAGVCTPYPGLGDPCEGGGFESNCGHVGHTCVGSCVEYQLEGEACSQTMPCSPAYRCEAGICAMGPTVGDPCEPDGDCIDDSYCHPTTLRCTAPQPDGAACQSSSECIGDCDFTTMQCVTDPVCI